MFKAKPHRLRTFDYLGYQRYFLTFCTHERRHLFVHPGPVNVVLSEILRACPVTRISLLAYCFMPDHVHLLVEGTEAAADGQRFIRLAKQYSGYQWRRRSEGPLWQRYGYERVLRSDEDARGVTRYILENPVRAGLVISAGEYPYSGSAMYSIESLLDAVAWTPDRSG